MGYSEEGPPGFLPSREKPCKETGGQRPDRKTETREETDAFWCDLGFLLPFAVVIPSLLYTVSVQKTLTWRGRHSRSLGTPLPRKAQWIFQSHCPQDTPLLPADETSTGSPKLTPFCFSLVMASSPSTCSPLLAECLRFDLFVLRASARQSGVLLGGLVHACSKVRSDLGGWGRLLV